MSLTTEQLAAVNSDARLLAVDAFAGTGKTTLLVAYAEARPRERILYVAFNKNVASEAASRFPRNVDSRTVHSIAYGAVGSRYKNKLANLGAFEVSRALRCGTPRARVVVDALNNWLSSADAALTHEHVPLEALEDPAEALDVLAQAQSMWKQMEDPRSPVPMTHDGYLKIWALSNPKLGYDRILLDEAQDTNPVVLDVIVKQQPRVALVLVGDRHQGIYGFRKSMNAMEAVPAEERVAITQSFRFGNDIGAVASELLAVFKAEARSIRGRDDIAVRWTVDRSKPHAILSRTNAGIFDRAAVLVRAKPNARLKFVGGFDRYPFGKILDAYHLWSGANGQVKDPAIARFKTFASMARYGREAGDAEVNGLVRVVDTHRHEIPRLYDEVKRAEVSDDRADAIFSTAHKSKGLEWDQVVLDEDFVELALDGADPARSRRGGDQSPLRGVDTCDPLGPVAYEPSRMADRTR